MNADYSQQLDEALSELVNAIRQSNDDFFNTAPFDGSWSAGQVTEHLLKSIEGLPTLFSSASIATERDPQQHEAELRTIFLDFETKMKSPEFLLPGDGPFAKQALLNRLLAVRQALQNKIKEIDLSQTFTQFSFPGVGPLTGFELLCFAYCHIARHSRQVRNIFNALMKNDIVKTRTK